MQRNSRGNKLVTRNANAGRRDVNVLRSNPVVAAESNARNKSVKVTAVEALETQRKRLLEDVGLNKAKSLKPKAGVLSKK